MTDRILVDCKGLTLHFGDWQTPCSIGRSGACPAPEKKEGDGCTPLGAWPMRAALFRAERFMPPAALQLPWRIIHAFDGWSDGPDDPAYNRPVRLPHGYSTETLMRDDMLYDVIVILGHNDDPPQAGKGSAIFFHLWDEAKQPDNRSTEGCVAISLQAMSWLLPKLHSGIVMDIQAG